MDISIAFFILVVWLPQVLVMVLVGIAGWIIGKKLGVKHPKYPRLRWAGLGFGLVVGFMVSEFLAVQLIGGPGYSLLSLFSELLHEVSF